LQSEQFGLQEDIFHKPVFSRRSRMFQQTVDNEIDRVSSTVRLNASRIENRYKEVERGNNT